MLRTRPLVPLCTQSSNHATQYQIPGTPIVLFATHEWAKNGYRYTFQHSTNRNLGWHLSKFDENLLKNYNGYLPTRVVVKSYTPLTEKAPLLIGHHRLSYIQKNKRNLWGQPVDTIANDEVNWFGFAPKQRVEYEIWVDGTLDGTYQADIEPTIRGKAISLVGRELQVELATELGGATISVPLPDSTSPTLLDLTNRIQRNLDRSSTQSLYNYAIRHDIEFTDDLRLCAIWMVLHDQKEPDTKGLHKYRALLEQMRQDDLCRIFLETHTASNTSGGMTNNKLIAKFFERMGGDLSAIRAKIVEIGTELLNSDDYFVNSYSHEYDPRKLLTKLPGVAEQIQADLEKKDWTKRKNAEDQAKGLLPEPERTPKLFEAIAQGKIPTSVFNQPSSKNDHPQPINREFNLIEESLSQEGWYDTVCEVAASAANRSTYERDFTSWLAFMLYVLPPYLNHHAPRPDGTSWKCMPKFVQSSWELEMNDTDENGTTKRRSAMTPVADNETGIVTVPYVAVRVAGAVTQFCYSRHYHLFQRGFLDPISNGVVTQDLELDLNGRDDYGLMFFTLNGTATATGYPTFLIIFERKQRGTTVHFHRVRPCRTVNGVFTPANELIKACYKYMAGNVAADQIVAQQGDIMVLKVPETESGRNNPIQNGAKIDEDATQNGPAITFESHKFVGPLSFFRSAAKTPDNRLGFIHAPEGLHLEHPEHDHTERLGPGWYEIRRAKSYENNPVGIWSLTID